MTRSASAFTLAAAVLAFSAGCTKEEKKAEPPAADTTVVQAAPGTQVQAGGTQVKAGGPNGATVTVQGAGTPVVMQNGQNKVTVQGTGANKVTEMKAEDGRKVVVQGDKMVAEDPNRPGAKVEIKGNQVIVPGVGTVTAPPH